VKEREENEREGRFKKKENRRPKFIKHTKNQTRGGVKRGKIKVKEMVIQYPHK